MVYWILCTLVGRKFWKEKLESINTHTFYLLLINARCGHCKKLLPIFEELAETIEKQNLSIRLGKVDAIAETEISEEEGVDRFPTLR